jgi:hypothetical protein
MNLETVHQILSFSGILVNKNIYLLLFPKTMVQKVNYLDYKAIL